MKFSQFLKNKAVSGAIFMGIFYQIIMIGLFIPGYSAIPKNIDELPVAVVNEDKGEAGSQIAGQLAKSLPFEIKDHYTEKEAEEALDDRDIHLIVHIPEDFSKQAADAEKPASIDFTVNEANPAIVSSTMTSVINQIETSLNKQFSLQYTQGLLANLNVPEEKAAEMAKAVQNQFKANTVTINEVPDGMNNTMAPFFLTMVSYVGSMIVALLLVQGFKAFKEKAGKWKRFGFLQAAGLSIAVVAPLIGIGIVYLLHNYGASTFFELWGHHAFQFFVGFQFNLIFLLLFGEAGMMLNLPLLLSQTVAGGAVMPREMMYKLFEWISYISPMYYSVQADFTTFFSDGSPLHYRLILGLIGAAALLINCLTVALKHKNEHKGEVTENIINS